MESANGAKRKRAAKNPIELVNEKSDEQFISDHFSLSAKSWSEWRHPRTQGLYSLSLFSSTKLGDNDLKSCFRLIEQTSRTDYELSSFGWKPKKKLAEMKSSEMKYILVKDGDGLVKAFTSFMPTWEEGEPVIYCYEIHLTAELQGTGLGRTLMGLLDAIAASTPPVEKVMLTCFLSNNGGLRFYDRLGYQKDNISPEPRKLRFGKEFIPDYVIMSKVVERHPTGLPS